MTSNPFGQRAAGNNGRKLAVGEERQMHARDKTSGEVTRTYTLTRTARDYVYDLCDAYNADIDLNSNSARWYVTAKGELAIG